MKTYEMVALADKNGMTYKSDDMFYNKEEGFFDSNGKMWRASAYVGHKQELFTFVHEDGWELSNIRKISDTIQAQYHRNNIILSSCYGDNRLSLSIKDIEKLYTFVKDLPFI